jgi:hypothetical protein
MVIVAVVIIAAAIAAGSVRVESDPLAPRPRFRPLNQLLGFGLLAGLVCCPALWTLSLPAVQQPTPWAGAVFFVLGGALFLGSSLRPQDNSVFWYLAKLADILPWRGSSGRSGLLFLGIVFGACGVYLVVAASGILG